MVVVKRLPISIFSKSSEVRELIGVLPNQSIDSNEIDMVVIKDGHVVIIPVPTRLFKCLTDQIYFSDFLIAGTAFMIALKTPAPPWIAPGIRASVLLPLRALTALSRFFES